MLYKMLTGKFLLLSQYIHAFGALGLLGFYLVLHFCAGSLMPYRAGAKPLLFRAMEIVGADFEKRLNRENRSSIALLIRGIIVALVCGIFAAFLGAVAGYADKKYFYGWFAGILFLSLCINFTAPVKAVRQVLKKLGSNDLAGAIAVLQPYVQEPLDRADTHTVIRKTMEFISTSLNRFLVAPAFWFIAAGSAGASLFVTFSALQQAFGLPDPRHKYFGMAARIINTVLNAVPSLLTTMLLILSSVFAVKFNPFGAVKTLAQAKRHSSPAKGWLIAAFAGGGGVTLGGPVLYASGYTESNGWIGPSGSSARLVQADLMRGMIFQYVFFICVLGSIPFLLFLTNL